MKFLSINFVSLSLSRLVLAIAILCAAILLPAQSRTAQAGELKGYLWILNFDFEADLNGELVLMVGPWQNGSLSNVEAKSSTVVACHPVGSVNLQKGYAAFSNGGYLQCTLDIATALLKNHGMVANALDSYGTFSMESRLQVVNGGIVPIFEHPDAQFWLTTPSPTLAAVNSDLSNGGASMSSLFSAILWNTWQTYSAYYSCAQGGACDMAHSASGTSQILVNQGAPQQFVTDAKTITIGKVGANTLTGRLDSLQIDPGNYGHH